MLLEAEKPTFIYLMVQFEFKNWQNGIETARFNISFPKHSIGFSFMWSLKCLDVAHQDYKEQNVHTLRISMIIFFQVL